MVALAITLMVPKLNNFDGTKADISSRDMIITCCPENCGEEGLLLSELIQVLRENDCVEY